MNIHELSPKKVAFVGDTHGNKHFAPILVKYLKNAKVDAVVQVGDFGIWQNKDSKQFLDYLSENLGVPLYFVDGNHEDHPYLRSLPIGEDGTRKVAENVYHLPRGFRWEWAGKSFLALGGALSVDKDYRRPYFDWFPEEEITYGEFLEAIKGGPVDVMVTHECPDNVKIPGLMHGLPQHILAQAQAQREVIGMVVEEVNPTMLVHGHHHKRYVGVRKNDNGSNTIIYGLACDQDYITDVVEFMTF